MKKISKQVAAQSLFVKAAEKNRDAFVRLSLVQTAIMNQNAKLVEDYAKNLEETFLEKAVELPKAEAK